MASKKILNNLINKNYVIITLNAYRDAFIEYNGDDYSRDEDYIRFDNTLGLKYVGMNNTLEYKFILKNKKKWFLAKIKYGF